MSVTRFPSNRDDETAFAIKIGVMMDKLLVMLLVLLANVKALFFKVIYLGRIQSDLVVPSPYFPSVRLRSGGSISCSHVKFRRRCSIFADGGQVNIGKGTFLNNDCSINSNQSVVIGANTLLGEGVKIYDHNHRVIDGVVSHSELDSAPVSIGSDCWIGSNVVILPGVSICDKVIIGAGSVVTKNITIPGTYVTENVKLKKLN